MSDQFLERIEAARAALLALRDPTPEMVEAMMTALDTVERGEAMLCWQAGIDAAMGEG